MKARILVAWLGLVWAAALFISARIIIPWLVNLQNDAALIAAPLFAFAVGTAAYVTYRMVREDME